jgi:hypothetical protein
VGLYKSLGVSDLPIAQAVILRHRDHWLKPELGLPVRAGHMDVHTGLFAGEEVKPERAIAEHGGAHGLILDLSAKYRSPNVPHQRLGAARAAHSL